MTKFGVTPAQWEDVNRKMQQAITMLCLAIIVAGGLALFGGRWSILGYALAAILTAAALVTAKRWQNFRHNAVVELPDGAIDLPENTFR